MVGGDLEGWGDRSRLRVSDAERHHVGEVLRQAAGGVTVSRRPMPGEGRRRLRGR